MDCVVPLYSHKSHFPSTMESNSDINYAVRMRGSSILLHLILFLYLIRVLSPILVRGRTFHHFRLHSSCTYDGWLEHTEQMQTIANNEMESSCLMRESLFVAREKIKNSLKSQQEISEYTLRKRIFDTQRIRNEFEWNIIKVNIMHSYMKPNIGSSSHSQCNAIDFLLFFFSLFLTPSYKTNTHTHTLNHSHFQLPKLLRPNGTFYLLSFTQFMHVFIFKQLNPVRLIFDWYASYIK